MLALILWVAGARGWVPEDSGEDCEQCEEGS